MVLQTGSMTPDDWEHFFIEVGISTDSAKTHATKFADELTIESLQMLDRSMLKELGVTLMGEALCILKQAEEASAQSTHIQALAAKPPNLNIEMTPQQFWKFQIDWDVFTKMTHMPCSQVNIPLYSYADETVQNAIILHGAADDGAYTAKDMSQIMEIEAYVVPFSPKPDPRQARDIPRNHSTKMMIFPNSGATICLGGLKHFRNMGLCTNNIIPSRKVDKAVGGFTLMCQGWLPVEFNVQGKTTKQALYICKKSKGCISAKQPELT